MFEVFTVAGTKYIAVPVNRVGGDVHIIDQNGNHYGAWFCKQSFIDGLKGKCNSVDRKSVIEPFVIGKARLHIVPE